MMELNYICLCFEFVNYNKKEKCSLHLLTLLVFEDCLS